MQTLVIGASPNSDKYSYLACKSLQKNGFHVIPFGIRKGKIGDMDILTSWDSNWSIHTVTLYINEKVLPEYCEKILNLKPKRVIFNPGTKHPEIMDVFVENKIEVIEACTLVMLSTGQYASVH